MLCLGLNGKSNMINWQCLPWVFKRGNLKVCMSHPWARGYKAEMAGSDTLRVQFQDLEIEAIMS